MVATMNPPQVENPSPKDADYIYNLEQTVSVNANMDVPFYDGEGQLLETVRFQVTSRFGASPEKIVVAFKNIVNAYAALRNLYPLPVVPSAPAPALDPAVKIALEEDNKPLAQEIKQLAEEVPAPPAGKQWHIENIVFVKILPQPGDLVTIEFYGNDRKTPHNQYPSARVTKWKLDRAIGLMRYVTSHNLQTPAEFNLPCKVYWTEGKQKDNGSFWQDVYHVRP